MIVHVCEIAQFTRATPGSSLVHLYISCCLPDLILTVEDGKFVVVLFGGEYSLLLHDLERLSRLEVEVVPAAN